MSVSLLAPTAGPSTQTTPKKTSMEDPVLQRFRYDASQQLFKCLECDYRADNRMYIRQHMVTHSDARPHECPYTDCDKTYKRKPELKRHIDVYHLEHKPYVCSVDDCRRAFTQLQSLKHHFESIHSMVRHPCRLNGCHKTFTTEKCLRSHQRRRHFADWSDEDFKKWVTQSTGENEADAGVADQNHSELPAKRRGRPRNRSGDEYSDPDYKPNNSLNRVSLRPRPQCSGEDGSKRRNGSKTELKNDSFIYDCNFEGCLFRTYVFQEIADHFEKHWSEEWTAINSA